MRWCSRLLFGVFAVVVNGPVEVEMVRERTGGMTRRYTVEELSSSVFPTKTSDDLDLDPCKAGKHLFLVFYFFVFFKHRTITSVLGALRMTQILFFVDRVVHRENPGDNATVFPTIVFYLRTGLFVPPSYCRIWRLVNFPETFNSF